MSGKSKFLNVIHIFSGSAQVLDEVHMVSCWKCSVYRRSHDGNGFDRSSAWRVSSRTDRRGDTAMTRSRPNQVSVVIPLYQKERHIGAALDSVYVSCEKANCRYEIVVIDDGSTDRSCDAVLDWIAKAPGHAGVVTLIRQKNTGAAGARNRGWKEASFDRILFLDADDHWLPGHAGEILALMDAFPEATLYADAWSEISPAGDPKQHVFGIGSERRGYVPCFFEAMCSGPVSYTHLTLPTTPYV